MYTFKWLQKLHSLIVNNLKEKFKCIKEKLKILKIIYRQISKLDLFKKRSQKYESPFCIFFFNENQQQILYEYLNFTEPSIRWTI